MKNPLLIAFLVMSFALSASAQEIMRPEPSSVYIKSYDELKKSKSKTGQYITDKDKNYEVYTNIPESGSAATWVPKSIESYQVYIPDFKQIRAFEAKYWSASLLGSYMLNFYFIRERESEVDTMVVAFKNSEVYEKEYTIDSIPFREGTYTIDLTPNEFNSEELMMRSVRLDDIIDWETMLYKSTADDGSTNELCNFSLGKRNGKYIAYHDNGEVKCQGEYTYDRKSGYWIFFNKDGTKEKEGPYDEDLEDGEWIFYDKRKPRKVNYNKGELVSD